MTSNVDNGFDKTPYLWKDGVQDGSAFVEPQEIIGSHNRVVEQMAKMLSRATDFRFGPHITVSWRGGDRWAVSEIGWVLNKDREWESEPLPSSRSQVFIDRTRFSLEEAFAMAEGLTGDEPCVERDDKRSN